MTTYPTWTPAAQQGIIPLHPLSFGQLFGRTFAALRRNPKVLLGFAVGLQVLGIVVTVVVVFLATFLLQARLETVPVYSEQYRQMEAGNTVALFAIGIPLAFLVQALTVVVQGVVAAEVAGSVVAEKQTLRQLWARVRPAFWRLFGYTLLLGAAMMIGAAIVFAPFIVMISANGGSDPTSSLVGSLLLIGMMLVFSVGMLWVTTKMVAVVPILVLERGRVFPAIARSWRLTRGRFWPTLGVLFLQNAIFSAVGQVVYMVTLVIAMLIGGVLNPMSSSVAAITGMVVAAGIGMLLYVVIAATGAVVQSTACALIYVDLRMRREGLDIDLLGYVERRDAGEAFLPDPYAFDPARVHAPSPQLVPAGAPQYGAPQYGAPQYGAPQYGAPQYGAPQYGAPQYGAPQYGAPQYAPPSPAPPQYGAASDGNTAPPPAGWPSPGAGS